MRRHWACIAPEHTQCDEGVEAQAVRQAVAAERLSRDCDRLEEQQVSGVVGW